MTTGETTGTIEVTTLEAYPSLGVAERIRIRMANGRQTTAHVARWPLAAFRLELVALDPPCPVERWCREQALADVVNGGFFTKPIVAPLGELVVDGTPIDHEPVVEPWRTRRGCVHLTPEGELEFGPRAELPERPAGSLLQAGPLLVRRGVVVVADDDPEGLSSAQEQFDSDITSEPLPRVAIGTTMDEELLAIAVDGRSDADDGLLLPELAALLVELGVRDALNLDGGSSSALVTAGVRRNQPRDDSGSVLVDGYLTTSVFVVRPR